MIYTKGLTKVSLAEFLRCYEQPISEEQAWAICFQCCYKMKQIIGGFDSAFQIVLDLDNLYIYSDGSVSFTIRHNFGSHTNQQQSDWLEDKLMELLGKLIYMALDWGIESHMERELSESLEKLISLMLKLNTETTKTAVALQDVIKICEDHFHRPSEAASHYEVICRVLFTEYIELQKLMFTIQSCKEYLGRMDVKDCLPRQKADDWACSWQGVLGDLQKGVKLHKPAEQPQHRTPLEECTRFPYNTVVDDIKNQRYTLRKVSSWKVMERACQEPSLHEQFMMEVKNPPKLRPTFIEKSRKRHQEDFQLSLNAPCGITFSDQKISITDISKAKKPQLSCIQSSLEPKLLPTDTQKMLARRSLPTIVDLMRTRYAEHVSETKDSCPKDGSGILSRTQMSVPVRPSVRLPLNFFKLVKLGKDDLILQGSKAAQLLYEIEHWDSSRVPLVLEPHCLSPPLACRIKSMMDWPSMDICNKCEQYLLETLSHQPSCWKRPLSWTEME
ncbi:hypothetical protein lerEdw1_012394 [Lerista edwardsae]|nr:hypothetical protein lerEdw1_012394 [Lerista edwardsae]